MATSAMGVMKIGNIAPRAGIELTSLAFWASVLTITSPWFHGVTILPIPIPTCLYSSLPERSVHTTSTTLIKHTYTHLRIMYAISKKQILITSMTDIKSL